MKELLDFSKEFSGKNPDVLVFTIGVVMFRAPDAETLSHHTAILTTSGLIWIALGAAGVLFRLIKSWL